MKGFTLGLALKQRRKATQKLPIVFYSISPLFLREAKVVQCFEQFLVEN